MSVTNHNENALLNKRSLTPSQINYSNLSDVIQHRHILSDFQVQMLRSSVLTRNKRKDDRYDSRYFENALFIIGSEPTFTLKYCLCGAKNIVNRSGCCKLRHFCSRCASYKFNQHWQSLKGAYSRGSFQFATFSFNGDLPFDIDRILLHWDAIQHGIMFMKSQLYIRGGLVSEELSINSLVPTRVLPHVHCVFDCDELNDAMLEEVSQEISNYRIDGIEQDLLVPDIDIKPIPEYSDYSTVMRYCIKPLDIGTAYRSAWERLNTPDRSKVWQLNSELKDVIGGHTELMKGNRLTVNTQTKRLGLRRFGTFHAHSKDYIGARRRKKVHKTNGKPSMIERLAMAA